MSGIPTGPFRHAKQTVETVTRRVFAAVVGRGDEPVVPRGWMHVANDADGKPLFAYLGPWRNPRREDLEQLAKAVQKRFGG